MHPSVEKYCIDEKSNIFTDEFEELDNAVCEVTTQYSAYHIAEALDKGLSGPQAVEWVVSQAQPASA